MRIYYYFVALLLLLASCGTDTDNVDNTTATEVTTPPTPPSPPTNTPTTTEPEELLTTEDPSPIFGSYVGGFEAKTYRTEEDITWTNKITIFLDSISGDLLYGHSVVAGNERPFQGSWSWSATSDAFHVSAEEPGDDRYDGVFHFIVLPNGSQLEGTWKANRNLPVSERSFELQRRAFTYDATLALERDIWTDLYGDYDEEVGESEFVTSAAAQYNASTEPLTATMVENMFKGDLEVMRNAIYARHGYSFKNRRMRYLFDNMVEWYMPYSTDIRNTLTPLEQQNIELLKRYEAHAEVYYDSFGR